MLDATTRRKGRRGASPAANAGDESMLGPRGSLLTTGLALIAVGICLFLVWQTISSLLVIFAGVLFAVLLDAAARTLAPILPVHRAWRLTLVVLLLAACLAFGLVWGAGKLPEQ